MCMHVAPQSKAEGKDEVARGAWNVDLQDIGSGSSVTLHHYSLKALSSIMTKTSSTSP